MNILIFSMEYVPYVGGAEIAVREICKRIPEHTYTVITSWNNNALPREEIIDGVRVMRVGVGVRGVDKYLLPFTGLWAALLYHRTHPYDAVWGIMANTAGLAALFFKLCHRKVKYILTLQEGDPERHYIIRTWFWWPLYMMVYRRADTMQVISWYLAERARRRGYQGPLSVIPNGVDTARFSAGMPRIMRASHERIIVTTSRLVTKNNVLNLVRAIGIIVVRGPAYHTHLFIIGDGHERPFIERLIDEQRLHQYVSLVGHCDTDEMISYMKSADVFVRASFSEGLGNSFLEAMAIGIPVVGSAVGGIVDFLIDRETGVVCDPYSSESIADAIQLVLEDEQLRARTIANGKRLIQEKYDWNIVVEKMRQFLS